MGIGIRRIKLNSLSQFLQSGGQLVEFVVSCAESMVSLRPCWLESHRCFEFLQGLPGCAFVSERYSQVVVRHGVVRSEFQGFAVSANRFVPRLGTHESVSLLPIALGGLGKRRRRKSDTQDKRRRHGQEPIEVNKRIPTAAFHREQRSTRAESGRGAAPPRLFKRD